MNCAKYENGAIWFRLNENGPWTYRTEDQALAQLSHFRRTGTQPDFAEQIAEALSLFHQQAEHNQKDAA